MKLPRISKSKYTTGLQCRLQQWWAYHEPQAEELVADDALLALFNRGHRVGERAREDFPGGLLIDLDPRRKAEAVEATREAIASDAPAIFEACFEEDGVFVAVDVLERTATGWILVEVKSSGSVKEAHLPDIAVQAHVLRRAGLEVEHVELMHLNGANRFPRTDDLFARVRLDEEVADLTTDIPSEIAAQRKSLAGPQPQVSPGEHCTSPYDCPFQSRCMQPGPEHPPSELPRASISLRDKLGEMGIESIADIPDDVPLNATQARHREAVIKGELVTTPGLAEAMSAWVDPLAYLDFESMSPFPPCWEGCGPFTAVPVQWSLHRRDAAGQLRHSEWLAVGSEDPRPALAKALLEATRDVGSIVVYSSYEARMLKELAVALPDLADKLDHVKQRLVDLLPVVRDHVAHPLFHGGFSIKVVLPALVPELTYDDLAISDGFTAAGLLEDFLFELDAKDEVGRARRRRDLLAYCERDTLAMVRLHERLAGLAPKSERGS